MRFLLPEVLIFCIYTLNNKQVMANSLCKSRFNYEFNINTCRCFGLDKIDDNKTKVKIGG